MTGQTIKLPILWMPYSTRVNPYLPALHAESEAWAREMGMLVGGEQPAGSRQEVGSARHPPPAAHPGKGNAR
ncbi:hypothetical protein [Streptomyces lavendulocolor]|uniref:hypothetical protein n=1 Tax=Streptomyces lavendulocolor TaxID=67316 RepID=UPI0033ECD017